MGCGIVKVGHRPAASSSAFQVNFLSFCIHFQNQIFWTFSHFTQGDWRKHHGANKESLYVLEPVIESLIQLLVQSILVYIVLGPSALWVKPH